MFYYISGKLVHTDPGSAVIDVSGVAYKMTVSGTTLSEIAAKDTVRLYTHLAVREDGIELFGFATEEELATFKLLIGVSGVGPKAAISVLSIFTPDKLSLAVANGDTKAIARSQNVGAKTAARIVLELKDKLAKEIAPAEAGVDLEDMTGDYGQNNLLDAQNALIVLGYTRGEAIAALRGVSPADSVENMIKAALQKMGR